MGNTDNDKFLKGLLAAMGLLISIMGIWSVWTQSNRFTWEDGERLITTQAEAHREHRTRIEAIEKRDRLLEQKHNNITIKLTKIEGLLLNLQYKLENPRANP